jgi:hypothetical protein
VHVAVENFVTLFCHRILLLVWTKPHYKRVKFLASEASISCFL